jgi:UDP-N-acetylmuramoylalanine--D-glutamate ligase
MKLENLKDKKIIILGCGREGKDTYKTLKKIFKDKKIDFTDQKLDKNYLEKLSKYDVIIKTPGIPLEKIKPYISSKNIVTSQTEIFLNNIKGKIIGVTGTKGKSTTSSLIYKILKDHKLNVKLIGNIGKPVLRYLLNSKPNQIFVYELSSHQLSNIQTSPDIAVFLNIYREHLDYYKNFTSYFKAKTNITKFQTKDNFFIFNEDFEKIKNIKTKANKIPIEKNFSQFGIHPDSLGAAIAVSRIFGITKKEIKESIKNFERLDSRMELVNTVNNVKYYNDSLATIEEATIFSLNQLKNVDTLILGGQDRGGDYKKLCEEIKKRKIRNIILFPDTGKKIFKQLKNEKEMRLFNVSNMKEAVKIAKENTKKICLLSPAAPSFNLFKDYKDRANQFKKYVNK